MEIRQTPGSPTKSTKAFRYELVEGSLTVANPADPEAPIHDVQWYKLDRKGAWIELPGKTSKTITVEERPGDHSYAVRGKTERDGSALEARATLRLGILFEVTPRTLKGP